MPQPLPWTPPASTGWPAVWNSVNLNQDSPLFGVLLHRQKPTTCRRCRTILKVTTRQRGWWDDPSSVWQRRNWANHWSAFISLCTVNKKAFLGGNDDGIRPLFQELEKTDLGWVWLTLKDSKTLCFKLELVLLGYCEILDLNQMAEPHQWNWLNTISVGVNLSVPSTIAGRHCSQVLRKKHWRAHTGSFSTMPLGSIWGQTEEGAWNLALLLLPSWPNQKRSNRETSLLRHLPLSWKRALITGFYRGGKSQWEWISWRPSLTLKKAFKSWGKSSYAGDYHSSSFSGFVSYFQVHLREYSDLSWRQVQWTSIGLHMFS